MTPPGRAVPAADRSAAVVEAHVLEADVAAAHHQRLAVGPVDHLVGTADGLHALLHHAHVLEDAGDHPQDPARHADDAHASGR